MNTHNRSANKKHCPFEPRVLEDLLSQMEKAFLEERANISPLNEEGLSKAGEKISALFEEMALFEKEVRVCPKTKLAPLTEKLRQVRLLREENTRLLQKALEDTGLEIKQSDAYRQAAKLYQGQEITKDLLLKKDC